jgi:hypothetical protein
MPVALAKRRKAQTGRENSAYRRGFPLATHGFTRQSPEKRAETSVTNNNKRNQVTLPPAYGRETISKTIPLAPSGEHGHASKTQSGICQTFRRYSRVWCTIQEGSFKTLSNGYWRADRASVRERKPKKYGEELPVTGYEVTCVAVRSP